MLEQDLTILFWMSVPQYLCVFIWGSVGGDIRPLSPNWSDLSSQQKLKNQVNT